MSVIRKLTIRLGVDLSDLTAGLDRAVGDIDQAARSIQGKLDGLAAPQLKGGDAALAGLGDGAKEAGLKVEDLAHAFAPVGAQIHQSLAKALAPLTQFAARFSAQFDQVGGAVLELAKRIDEHMRFPGFVERVEQLRKIIRKTFGLAVEDAEAAARKAAAIQADPSKLVAGFEDAAKKIKKAVAPIPHDVGYALEQATHVDAKGAFDQYIKGVDEARAKLTTRAAELGRALEAGELKAKGPGGRKRFWARRDNAAELQATLEAAPPRANTTDATKPQVDRLAVLRKAYSATKGAAEASFAGIGAAAKGGAFVVDKALGVYLKVEKAKHFLSTLGSVAEKSFAKIKQIKPPDFKFDFATNSITNINNATNAATGSMVRFGGAVAVALGAFNLVGKGVEFLKKGVAGASDLNETISKTDAILGEASPAVKGFADDMARQFGLVKKETLDAASGFAGLGKGLAGLKGEALSDFSTKFTKLSADVSSFANLDFAEASRSLKVVLSGEQSDALKQLGVIINETTTKQYAYANGIAKVGSELTEEQKLLSRAGQLTAALGDASGDLERTQGGAANQTRKFWGSIENLGTSIGMLLLPAVNKAITLFNELATWVQDAFNDQGGTIETFGATVSGIFDGIGIVFRNWSDSFEVAKLSIAQGIANLTEWFGVLGPNLAMVAEYVADNWTELFADAFNAIMKGAENLVKNFRAVADAIAKFIENPTGGISVDWTPLFEGFKATAKEFPALIKPVLTDFSAEMEKRSLAIIDREQKRAEGLMKKAGPDPGKAQAEKRALVDAKALKAQAKEESELEKFAKGLDKKTDTPLEKFKETAGRIKEAFAKGLIDEQTGLRGLAKAQGELAGDGPKFAGAVEAGSTEARSALLAAITGRGKDKVADNTANLVKGQGAGNVLLARIAEALKAGPAPEFLL